jgi:hypothetical protein
MPGYFFPDFFRLTACLQIFFLLLEITSLRSASRCTKFIVA